MKILKQIIPLSAILLGLTPLSALANKVEITRQYIVDNEVVLRFKVVNDERVPLQGLKAEDFVVETTDKNGKPIQVSPDDMQLISSEQTKPDPSYLIVLLDMSGSMKHPDLGGTVKLKGATNGLQDFLTQIQEEKLPVQIALVPFGIGEKCANTYPVTDRVIGNKFESAPYTKTKNKLTELAKVEVCAATNIYQPLSEAIRYLSNSENIENLANQNTDSPNPQKSPDKEAIPPRLGVILFSDGFDVFRSNENQRFNDLKALMEKYPEISVHTMGYGERLYQLRDRTNCSVSGNNPTVDSVLKNCKLYDQSKNIIDQFIVDEPRLKEIADITLAGIHRFPGDPREVIKSLRTFLTTLREYEIRFQQPDGDRGSQHTTYVVLDSDSRGLDNIESQKVTYRMNNYVYESLPLAQRLRILAATVILGSGGYLGFLQWSKFLVAQSQSYLTDQTNL
ncbi:MAG: VWA domain-containing protein [Crocosphaera sp.]|nr:VWA domain-containing protein [Crocosphaera sp.]